MFFRSPEPFKVAPPLGNGTQILGAFVHYNTSFLDGSPGGYVFRRLTLTVNQHSIMTL